MNKGEQKAAFDKITNRAKSDDGFKKDLMENPARILQENGVKIPAGTEIQVSADKDSNICVSVCSANGELSEQDLTEISGGLIWPKPPTIIKGKKYTNVSGCSIII